MDSNPRLIAFNKKKDELESPVLADLPKRGKKKGIKYNALWGNNYRRRIKHDRMKKLHHKYLKYPKSLDQKIKEVMGDDWTKDLNITCENDMFVRAVEILISKNEKASGE